MALTGGGVGAGIRTGIGLYVTFASDETLEIYRDTSSGFGTQELVGELVGGDQHWVDPLPLDNTYRYYRVRSKDQNGVSSYVNLGSPTGYKPAEAVY